MIAIGLLALIAVVTLYAALRYRPKPTQQPATQHQHANYYGAVLTCSLTTTLLLGVGVVWLLMLR